MLQKSRSKTIAKLKFLVLLPLMLVMLTYVACSDDAKPMIETAAETGDQDAALKAALWEEITAMDKNGAGFSEISEAFFIETDAHIKSKEAYYRFQAFMRMIHEKAVEREKAAGTYDENAKNPFQSILDQDYDEYVAKQENEPRIEKETSLQDGEADVPIAVIDEVPIYPGCEDLANNEEYKACMSEKVKDHVNKNFNTAMGKELGLTGVNRIIAVFNISKDGTIKDIRARAPHPDLEVEAIRVISSLPKMTPGKHNGVETNVTYSLPIVFEVKE